MTTTDHLEETITENITRWIAARGTTRAHLYNTAGMSRQTFERSMAGGRSFTFRELTRISEALGIPFTQLLTPAHQVLKAAA